MTPESRERLSKTMRAKFAGRERKNKRRDVEIVNPDGTTETRSYGTLHCWMSRHYTKGTFCWSCGKGGPLDWAHRNDRPWTREIGDWWVLCRSCNVKTSHIPEAEMPVVLGFAGPSR